MSTVISTKTSGVGGLTVTGDASGILQLASANGTTAVTIDASQNVSFTKAINKAALPTGSVLQVVNATYSTGVSTTSTSYTATGLTATITPLFSTSKILVLVTQAGLFRTGTAPSQSIMLRVYRDSTNLLQYSYQMYAGTYAFQFKYSSLSSNYLDAPATISSVTYSTQFATLTAGQTVGVQQDADVSTITLMEIAA